MVPGTTLLGRPLKVPSRTSRGRLVFWSPRGPGDDIAGTSSNGPQEDVERTVLCFGPIVVPGTNLLGRPLKVPKRTLMGRFMLWSPYWSYLIKQICILIRK